MSITIWTCQIRYTALRAEIYISVINKQDESQNMATVNQIIIFKRQGFAYFGQSSLTICSVILNLSGYLHYIFERRSTTVFWAGSIWRTTNTKSRYMKKTGFALINQNLVVAHESVKVACNISASACGPSLLQTESDYLKWSSPCSPETHRLLLAVLILSGWAASSGNAPVLNSLIAACSHIYF